MPGIIKGWSFVFTSLVNCMCVCNCVYVCGRTPEPKQKPQRKKTSPQTPDQQGCPTSEEQCCEWRLGLLVLSLQRDRERERVQFLLLHNARKEVEPIFTEESVSKKVSKLCTNVHIPALHYVQSSVTLWFTSVQKAPADSGCS